MPGTITRARFMTDNVLRPHAPYDMGHCDVEISTHKVNGRAKLAGAAAQGG